MNIDAHLRALERARATLKKGPSGNAAHAFARAVDALGYCGERELKAAKVRHGSLVRQAIRHYEAWLATGAKDAAALNNIGVLLCNMGWYRKARPWLSRALALDRLDSSIHENLRIVDIMMHKPRSSWHKGGAGLARGRKTLVAYFDAHGM